MGWLYFCLWRLCVVVYLFMMGICMFIRIILKGLFVWYVVYVDLSVRSLFLMVVILLFVFLMKNEISCWLFGLFFVSKICMFCRGFSCFGGLIEFIFLGFLVLLDVFSVGVNKFLVFVFCSGSVMVKVVLMFFVDLNLSELFSIFVNVWEIFRLSLVLLKLWVVELFVCVKVLNLLINLYCLGVILIFVLIICNWSVLLLRL